MTERNTAKPEDYGYTNGSFYESMRPEYEQDHVENYSSVDAVYKNEELGFTIRVRTVGEPETIHHNGRDYQVSRIRALEVPRLPDNPTAEQIAVHTENLEKFNNDEGHLVLTSSLERPERSAFEHRKAIIHTEDGSLQRTSSDEVLEVEVLSEPYEVGGKGETDGRVVVKVKDSSGSGPPQIREVSLASIEIDWTRDIDTSGRASMSIHERELQEYIASLETSGFKSTADDLQRLAEGEQDYLIGKDNENIEQREATRDEALERANRVRTNDEAAAALMEERAQKTFLRPENGYMEGGQAHHEAADHLRRLAGERVSTNNTLVYIVEQSTAHQGRGEVWDWGLNAFSIQNRDLIDSFRISLAQALERSETPNYIREHKTAQGDVLVDYYYKCGSDDDKPMYYIEQRDLASGKITLIGVAVLKDDSLDAKRSYHLPAVGQLDREGAFKPGDHIPYHLDSLTTGILERDGVARADIDDAMQTVKIDRRSRYQKLKAISRRRRAHSAEGSADGGSLGEPDDASEPLSSGEPSAEGVVEPATDAEPGATDADAEPPVETNGKPPRRRLRDRLWRKPKPADTPPINLQVSPAQERLMAEQDGQVSPSEPVAPAEDSVEASIEPPTDDSGDIPTGTFHSADAEPSGETPMAPTEPSSTDLDVETSSETREAIWHLGDGVGDRRVKIRNELINTGTGQYYQILADIDGNEINTIVPADQIELQGSR